MEAIGKTSKLDPRTITTARIAQDLEALRVALGIETWNLLGISYGTRLALAYDRAYPGRARSLVLDGVVPFSMVVGEHATRDSEGSLAVLDARCTEKKCAKKSLADIVRALRAELSKSPKSIRLMHPVTNVAEVVELNGHLALGMIRLSLYSEETTAILPPVLTAADAGDLGPLAAQLVMTETLEDSIAVPMQLSVLCAEDVPFFSDDAVSDAALFPDFRTDLRNACKSWPHATVPRSFHDDAPTSNTPALLLSGTADPVTPPPYAEAAQKTLPNSVHVVGRGSAHNLTFRGCIPEMIDRFLDAPAPKELDVSCAADLAPFPVFIDALGPSP